MKSNSSITPEDFPSTSQFDLLNATPESGYASESVKFSNKTSVLEPNVSMSNQTPSEVMAGRNGNCKPYSA